MTNDQGIELLFAHNSATHAGEPAWGSVDKAKLPRIAHAEMGEAGKKSTWGYPHHWVSRGKTLDKNGCWSDGLLYLSRGGLNAAWSAAMGGRSGRKASPAVIAHLGAHRKALGMEGQSRLRPGASEWLRAPFRSPGVGVDRAAEVIRGYVVAQEGPFKTPGRGEFDRAALDAIAGMVNAAPSGLKSRLSHPTASDNGIGTFLGRAKSARLDQIAARDSEGQLLTNSIAVVRADLHLDRAVHVSPSGDLANYVLTLAESDPDAFSSSLVIQADKHKRLDAEGKSLKGPDGGELPPLWVPKRLHASDVVDTGDAVDGFLSVSVGEADIEQAPWQAAGFLTRLTADWDRAAVEGKAHEWLSRYLEWRFGANGKQGE